MKDVSPQKKNFKSICTKLNAPVCLTTKTGESNKSLSWGERCSTKKHDFKSICTKANARVSLTTKVEKIKVK